MKRRKPARRGTPFSNQRCIWPLFKRLQFESDLRHAVADPARAGLRLVYQPIVHLDSGDISSMEALLRWQHPTRGAISPTVFIPETVIMRDTENSLTTLQALKSLGVKLAIDDFGTGYSSLSYLQKFAVDVLKIDRAFVEGVQHGGSDTALAKTIIALGQTLGLKTVAEGVELESQRKALRSLGCVLGQGYLFSKPREADELTSWLDLDRVRRLSTAQAQLRHIESVSLTMTFRPKRMRPLTLLHHPALPIVDAVVRQRIATVRDEWQHGSRECA